MIHVNAWKLGPGTEVFILVVDLDTTFDDAIFICLIEGGGGGGGERGAIGF